MKSKMVVALLCLVICDRHVTAAGLQLLTDLPFGTNAPEQKLDLYVPAAKDFPTVVYVYGGGWRSGSGKSSAPIALAWQRNGIGCALVSHRLAPRDPITAQAEDVASAFAWVKAHIGERGGDPQRVFLAGHSSGAHLALLVATDAKYLATHKLTSVDVAGVVGLSALVDLMPHADGHGYGNVMAGPRGRGVFPSEPAQVKAISPSEQLRQKLPCTLLLVGSDDFPMLANDARMFAQKAEALGTQVLVEVIPGKDHLGMARSLATENDVVFERVTAFIRGTPTATAQKGQPVP